MEKLRQVLSHCLQWNENKYTFHHFRTPRNLNPGIMTPSPRGSPKSPRSPRNLTINPGSSVRYFSNTPLSPIPPSPLPTPAAASGYPRPHSPVSPTWQSRPTSPRPGSSSGHYRPQSPVMGNLARLASRRRSNAVGHRRTSNFLELPGKNHFSWAAAIAPWFRLRLPSCGPGFESQAQHLCFFNLYT